MLIKSLYGTRILNLSEIECTKETLLEQFHQSLPVSNISFRDLTKKFNIETVGEGHHFTVYTINGIVHEQVPGFYQIDNVDHFIDFILNFDINRLGEFTKDKDMSLKFFIDNLTSEEKDNMLYQLIKAQQPDESHYFEIVFYGEGHELDWTFYLKSDTFLTNDEVKDKLRTQYLGVDGLATHHLDHIVGIYPITAKEFTDSCGQPA